MQKTFQIGVGQSRVMIEHPQRAPLGGRHARPARHDFQFLAQGQIGDFISCPIGP
jgi:hypothetical protein